MIIDEWPYAVADPRGGGGQDPPEIPGKKFLHMKK